MAVEVIINNFTTTLAAQLLAAATSMTLQSGDGAILRTKGGAGNFFRAVMASAAGVAPTGEIILVTIPASGDVCTIARQQEGTVASPTLASGSLFGAVNTSAGMTAWLGVNQPSGVAGLDSNGNPTFKMPPVFRYTGAVGSGYTTATVTLTGGTGGAVTANIVSGQVVSYTVATAGTGYTQGTSTASVSGDGSGALCSLQISSTGTIASVVPVSGNVSPIPYSNLHSAIVAAQPGDTIVLGAGTFDLTSANESACNFIAIPNNVTLRGMGWNTVIYSNQNISTGTHTIVVLGSNCTVENLTIKSPATSGDSTLYGPIGAFTGDSPFTNAVVRNVQTIGVSDGVYVKSSSSASPCTAKFFNCFFDSLYDCTNLNNGNVGDLYEFYGCRGYAHPGTNVNDARGLNLSTKGTAISVGCWWQVVNGQNTNAAGYLAAPGATIKASGSIFQNDPSSTATINAGIYSASTTAFIQLSGCSGSVTGGIVTWLDSGAHWIRSDINLQTIGGLASGLNSFASTFYQLPSGAQIIAEKQKITSAVNPGDVATLTSSIGIGGNATKYSSAFNLLGATNAATFYSNVGSEAEGASTLGAAITLTTSTSLTMASTTGFPSTAPFMIQIDSEILNVTNVSGTTYTVQRHQNNTTAATHLNGATVTMYSSAIQMNFTSTGDTLDQLSSGTLTVWLLVANPQ